MKPRPHKAIKDAYDIQQARSECKAQGLQSRIAYAYMKSGFVVLSLLKSPPKPADDLQAEVALCHRWLAESNFRDALLSWASFPKISNTPRVVRCVASSNGSGWSTWDNSEVCRRLCSPSMGKGKGWSFIPVMDSDYAPAVTGNYKRFETHVPVHVRLWQIAQGVLLNAAQLHVQAEQIIEGFLEAYNKLDLADFCNDASQLATLICRAKNAALRQMEACLDHVFPDLPRLQDEAIASHVGYSMGRWVAQAEAIIANARAAKLAATAGAGKPRSEFWKWINSEAKFAGKGAKEVWPLLHRCNDPDHPGKKLMLKDNRLQRGNGDWLKLASFTATFKKRRGSIFQR